VKTPLLMTALAAAISLAGCASYDMQASGIPGQQAAGGPNDPDAVAAPVAAKPAPVPAPAAKPAPAPAAPAAAPKKPAVLNLASTELFEFNRASLTQQARDLLDKEVVGRLKDLATIRYVNVNGHADRLGSVAYNQKLSERRAEAVKAYLVSRGTNPDVVETFGWGKTLPEKSCPDQKDRKALIECLAPNRRVVVEVQGTPR
jgi:OmpA-OmpF porin, OOP family